MRRLPPPSPDTKNAQLDLFVDAPAAALPTEAEIGVPRQLEVIPPARQVSKAVRSVDEPSHPPTDGQLEHEYLVQKADKYEDRCFRAAIVFWIAAVLTVLAKGGIQISEIFFAQ